MFLWEKVFSGQPVFSAGNQQTLVQVVSQPRASFVKRENTSPPALSDIADEYVILARTNSQAQDVYLLKINAQGDSLWSKSYPTPNREVGNTIIQTTDGGFAVLGNVKSSPNDLFLMKLNSQGDYQWSTQLDIYIYDEGYALKESSEGGFYLFGLSNRIENQQTDYSYPCLVKIDAIGNKEWENIFELDKEKNWGTSMSYSSDGNYYLSIAGSHDSYVLKINSSGNVFWQKHFTNLTAYCVAEAANGQVIMMGNTWKYGDTNLKLFFAHVQ